MSGNIRNDRPGASSNISALGPRFDARRIAIAVVRGALAVVALCTLLLVVARPAQAQKEHLLHTFTGGTDGLNPWSSLVYDGAGNFYGTTVEGGLGCPGNSLGCGVVYEISPNGYAGWEETLVHSFNGPPDSANSWAPVVFDKSGNLYGTTGYGGEFNAGAVFKLSRAGTGWTSTVLYSFTGWEDGWFPVAGLTLDAAGNLYGTTRWGGAYGEGVVFKVAPGGGQTVLYSFGSQSGDGSIPTSGLLLDKEGNICGTTSSGGAYGGGTVFKLTPTGVETVLYSFGGWPGDASGPGGLVVYKGNLYGEAGGGAYGLGAVFKLTPTGVETVLYSFGGQPGDGSGPSGLVFDERGAIYGATYSGGAYNDGTVFKLTLTGDEAVLYSFGSYPSDGVKPLVALVFDKVGNLYGTTTFGGAYGAGTVFELTP